MIGHETNMIFSINQRHSLIRVPQPINNDSRLLRSLTVLNFVIDHVACPQKFLLK